MMRRPHTRCLLYRTAVAACLSAGVAVLAGCVSRPVNTNASNVDPNLRGNPVAPNDWEKNDKNPAINAETFYAAGQLNESQELWDRAIEQYDKAIKLNPNHQGSLFRLGVIYAKFKKFPQAIAVWKQYLSATGGDPTGYANLGFCEELAGQFDEAENVYEAGIRRDPNSAPCRVNYGLMLARRGRFNQAMHEWQVVLPPAEVHYNLGSAYEAVDRKQQAKIEFHKALDLDPHFADARARLEALGEKLAAIPSEPSPVAQLPAAPEAPAAPAAPTTEPVAVAEAPAAVNPDLMPDTKPVEEVSVPTTAPSTQPVAAAAAPTTMPTASTDAPTTAPVTDVSAGDSDRDE